MDDLFTEGMKKQAPLADRMRPRVLDEFLGQEHIVGKGKLLRRAIEADRLTSSIFYGPPGTGKTTLANIIANTTHAAFEKLNAVTSGVADVREVIQKAESRLKLYSQPTYLLLDECHRWNKAQSDSILPAIEKGVIRFIGSTTENPMLAMTPAIVSRCRVFQFEALNKDNVKSAILAAAADRERGFGDIPLEIEPEALEHIASVANGDARSALNALELAVLSTKPDSDGITRVTAEVAEESIQKRQMRCDESYFYDMLSAFCKSLRGSDSDAALAWAFRLLHAGADPRIIVRRMIAHASEDVGLANPNALLQAVAALQALEFIGLPEARLAISQAIIFICESPKSNSVVMALAAASEDAEKSEFLPVPVHLRDTSYKGFERLGSGVGYKYAHDFEGHYVEQEYMPVESKEKKFYHPSNQGYECKIRELRKQRGKGSD